MKLPKMVVVFMLLTSFRCFVAFFRGTGTASDVVVVVVPDNVSTIVSALATVTAIWIGVCLMGRLIYWGLNLTGRGDIEVGKFPEAFFCHDSRGPKALVDGRDILECKCACVLNFLVERLYGANC